MKEENQDGSSSAIASAGATRQEYPIRALVRADAMDFPSSGLSRGNVISVRRDPTGGYWAWAHGVTGGLYFMDREVILDPTPEQIAEERAKAGLPPQDLPGAPPSAEEAMIEIRGKLRGLGFSNTNVDEIMSVFIDCGWRPKAEAP